jgi:hypothetical protein
VAVGAIGVSYHDKPIAGYTPRFELSRNTSIEICLAFVWHALEMFVWFPTWEDAGK